MSALTRVVLPASRPDGTLVQLIDFLARIDGARWRWTLFDLEAFAPDVEALEAASTHDDAGVTLGWEELLAFAASIRQTIWLTLVATTDSQPSPQRTNKHHTAACVIDAFDGSEWTITFDDAFVDAQAIAQVGA